MAIDERTDFVVAGGGIGGWACTLALAREGYSVRVLERTAELREIGAGIQMAPNATRVLSELGILNDVIGRVPSAADRLHALGER
jgi:salicylate hydroxylase